MPRVQLTSDGDSTLKGMGEALPCFKERQQEGSNSDENHDDRQPVAQDLHLYNQVCLDILNF